MSERIFNVSRSTKTGKTVNVGDFPTVEQAQAAMLSHYKVTPKRGDFRYRIFEEELEEINGVTFRKFCLVLSGGNKPYSEEIEGHSFTACPACGKDVVEGLSRAEFEDEYFRPRYSVVVRQFSGSVRGYIVSANSRHEVMKRLLEKLDFNYVAEVSIGEILVKEDEF